MTWFALYMRLRSLPLMSTLWSREDAEIVFANGNFVSTSINFKKQKRWRRWPGQDNRESNFARFSCALVFTQPGWTFQIQHSANTLYNRFRANRGFC
jgi:hypothetical protein